ncbi:O-antigen ligase family protein [Novosphingobium sp. KCTC 2891]|uniref:O-antigen ligase family protein n=1 Tax=Novosphingobium sp. KCTC 2891 TaxID=2989730 RepID=UPI0022230EC9|nr:O-antigen ligase family protein [Novosphingobium sp. KCTC 2891]MCW1383264.1 O-antigen ligase family protein [Novosphingobium sp. KCTC 2891]
MASATGFTWVLLTYAILVGAWMADFRTQAGGGGEGVYAQLLFALLHFGSFGAFLMLDKERRIPLPGLLSFTVAVLLFLIVGTASGLVYGQQSSEILRTAIGTVLYLTTAFATCRVVASQDLRMVRLLLAWLSLGYVVMAVVSERIVGGPIDFSMVRFQILSGATIPVLGYIDCLFLFGLGAVELVSLGLGGLLVFLSVTRTYLLVALLQFSTLLRGIRNLVGPRTLLLVALGVVATIGVVSQGSGGLTRWTDRFTDNQSRSGEDFSYYTRQSEWSFMYDAFVASTKETVFGHGFAARTTWWFPKEAGGRYAQSIGFGHNQYLSILFIGGLAGGAALLLVQCIQFIQSVLLLVRISMSRNARSDLLFLAAWGAAIIVGMFGANILSSVLGNRGWGLWYGLGTGLFIGARARFKAMSAAGVPVATGGQPAPQPVRAGPALPPAVARRRQALQARQGEASRA